MKKLMAIVLLVAVALAGCAGAPAAPDNTPTPIPTDYELWEGFGIMGETVEMGDDSQGVYPGWSGTATLTIINGKDRDRFFVVYAVEANPAKLMEGFEALPEEYLVWLTVREPEFSIAAGQSREVDVTLAMPKDADYADKHAEVRVRVDDVSQAGLVQIALESRWFIIFAE